MLSMKELLILRHSTYPSRRPLDPEQRQDLNAEKSTFLRTFEDLLRFSTSSVEIRHNANVSVTAVR